MTVGANSMLDQFENTFTDYTAELKDTGNKYSLLTGADIDEHLIYEDFLMVCPMFGEVLELDDKDKHEAIAFWLDETRGQTLEENVADLENTRVEWDKIEGAGDPDDEELQYTAMITILEYVIEEQTTGVSLPKVSDPVE